jgi:hypothetical protein
MEHTNKLTSMEVEFVLHRRLEVKLNTMDIVRTGTSGRALGTSASHSASDRRRTSRSWARGSGEVFSPCWARWSTCVIRGDRWWKGKLRGRRRD